MKMLRLLLVDDEQEFATTLAERLELRGYTVRTEENGETALSLFPSPCFDLVILDLMMPGMKGLTVLARIREIQPDLPVILLTGHGSAEEGMEGIRLGAFDYLMKPLRIEALIDKIQEAVPSNKV